MATARKKQRRKKRNKKQTIVAKFVHSVKVSADFLSQGRAFVVNIVLILCLLILVPILIRESITQNVIIEPITWPKALTDLGYSGDVGAYRLWDAFEQISAESTTRKERPHLLASAQQFEFTIPEQGGSIKSIIISVKKFLHFYDTRIAGEFICQEQQCTRETLALRIRIFQSHVTFMQFESIGKKNEDEYFHNAALQIMKVIEPYVAAAYLFGKNRSESMDIARHLIRAKHVDAKWAINLIGADYMDNSDRDNAIVWFKKAMDYDSSFTAPYINIGRVYESLNNWDEAKRYYKIALQKDPNFARAYARLGLVAGHAGDKPEAERNFDLALKLQPEDSFLYNDFGVYYRRHGDNSKAKEYFEHAAKLNPFSAPPHYNLALIHSEDRKFDEAEKLFKRVLHLQPNSASYHLACGNFYLQFDRFDDALRTYAAAINLNAQNNEFLYHLAVSAERAKRFDIAIQALQKFTKATKNSQYLPEATELLERLSVGSVGKK